MGESDYLDRNGARLDKRLDARLDEQEARAIAG
jgi:hypothetical protein